MIEIKLAGPEQAGKICRKSGIPFRKDIRVYQAEQNGSPCGTVAFTCGGNESEILALDAPDDLMADGLLRSALSYLLTHGCPAAECVCPVDEQILRNLHFSRNAGGWSVAVSEDIFRCGCTGPAGKNPDR